MVAVPRRTPDRGVDHRPRDHRDAGLTGPQRVGGFRVTRWAVRSCSSVEHRAYRSRSRLRGWSGAKCTDSPPTAFDVAGGDVVGRVGVEPQVPVVGVTEGRRVAKPVSETTVTPCGLSSVYWNAPAMARIGHPRVSTRGPAQAHAGAGDPHVTRPCGSARAWGGSGAWGGWCRR